MAGRSLSLDGVNVLSGPPWNLHLEAALPRAVITPHFHSYSYRVDSGRWGSSGWREGAAQVNKQVTGW